MTRILIIDDDKSLRTELANLISSAGYETMEIKDVSAPLTQLVKNIIATKADLILLDLNLIYQDGQRILENLRLSHTTPVIILTGNAEEARELATLETGADDFIAKPFRPEILLSRIAAVLRRAKQNNQIYHFQNLSIDLIHSELRGEQKSISLSKSETIILRTLLETPEHIISRERLMVELWNNETFINKNALNVLISRLRNKIKRLTSEITFVAIRGKGYAIR